MDVTGQATLLLIAHGSSRYPDAAGPLWRHVEAMRTENPASQIEVGLLNGDPSIAASLASISAETIHAVPFFMEAGYFTKIAVPRALNRDPRVQLCAPVGVHPEMVEILVDMGLAGSMALDLAPAAVAVLVVGHGSATAPGRALALQAHGSALEQRHIFDCVSTACLEEAPFLPDALRSLAASPVVVIGFFAGEGMHVRDDVPRAIAAERKIRGPLGQPVLFQGSVADNPRLRSIIRALAAPQYEKGTTG